MPVSFVLAGIMIVLGVISLLAWMTLRKTAKRKLEREKEAGTKGDRYSLTSGEKAQGIAYIMKYVMLATMMLGLFLVVVSSCTTVGTKQVGVVTEFNRPVDTLDNGLHWRAPWTKVTEMDAAIQTDNYVGDGAVQVRLANQSTAKVDTSVRWRIIQEAAGDLFRDYRGFDKIRDSLVERNMKEALNEVFKNYDPLSTVKSAGTNKQLTLQQLGTQVTKELRQRVGNQVEIQNVIIPLIRFDEGTQQRIDAYQAEIANTRIAAQRQETAAATARANRILAASVSKDPNVIVARCIEVLEELAKDGNPLPAGFSCWPGGNAPAAVPVQ